MGHALVSAPCVGEPNRSDVSNHWPANSTLARFNPEFTRTQLRSYERGLAAVVLGSSGLAREREHPCLSICHGRKTTRSESLFTVALARLERRGDAAVLLREALAKTRADTQITAPTAWGSLIWYRVWKACFSPAAFLAVGARFYGAEPKK